MDFGIGDLVKWQGRKYIVGRVWTDGDLRLEYPEEVGYDWGCVHGEHVDLLVKAPAVWLHRSGSTQKWWGDLGRRVQPHDDWKTEAPTYDKLSTFGPNAR